MRSWLKKLRENKGFTQMQTSEMLGLSQNHYGNIENGKRRSDLNLSLMIKISELFGITLEQIAELEKERK